MKQSAKLFDGKTKKSRPLSNRFSLRDLNNIKALSYTKGWGFSMTKRKIITATDIYSVSKNNGRIIAVSDSGNVMRLSNMMNDKVIAARVFLRKLSS